MDKILEWVKKIGYPRVMLTISLFITSIAILLIKLTDLLNGDKVDIQYNLVLILLLTGVGTLVYSSASKQKEGRVGINLFDLNEAISLVKKELPFVKEMKILANATDRFLPALQSSEIKIESVKLLLRMPNTSDQNISKYTDYMKGHILSGWDKLEKNATIQNLEIKFFNFLAPDWQVIFDDKYMILGLNLPDKNNIQGFEVFDTILFVGNANEEYIVIQKYTNRFDEFFKDHGIKREQIKGGKDL